VTTDQSKYEWREGWAALPNGPAVTAGWAHHGVAVLSDGTVVAFHPGESTLLVFDDAGELKREVPIDAIEAHGITAVIEGGEDRLWVADNGVKVHKHPGQDLNVDVREGGGRVVQVNLDGAVTRELERPPVPDYAEGGYAPTAVAVDEERLGGSGDIWVADGYGKSLVHRFDRGGRYVATLNGDEGGGRFNCPHSVFIDRRREEPELYVTDRGNARIQVFGLDATFRRVVGDGVLNSPSALATSGSLLVVAELNARLTLLDADDELVTIVGEDADALARPGWPNALGEDGKPIPPALTEGRFNSPHGLAVDASGNLYVAEWLLGGRHVRLAPTE